MKKIILSIALIFPLFQNAQAYLPFQAVEDSANYFHGHFFHNVITGDLDTDGFEDVFFYYFFFDNYIHFKSLGNGGFEIIEDSLSSMYTPLNYCKTYFPDSIPEIGYVGLYELELVDVNSDGLDDLIISFNIKTEMFTNVYCDSLDNEQWWLTFLRNSTGTFEDAPSYQYTPQYTCNCREWGWLDWNEDGYMDLLARVFHTDTPDDHLELYQFEPQTGEFSINESPLDSLVSWFMIHDIDLNGYGDIISRDYIHFKNGPSQFQTADSANYPFNQINYGWSLGKYSRILDFENDGFLEYLFFGSYEEWNLYSQYCDPSFEGQPCSDGSECTTNDSYDEFCNCTGDLALDADGDGICDFYDQCPGQNDQNDQNLNGIPDCLEYQNAAQLEGADDEIVNDLQDTSQIEGQIRIYPNPSEAVFTIAAPYQLQDIALFDTYGKSLPIFSTNERQLDLSHLPKGMYLIQAKVKDHIFRKKILLK